MSNGGVRRELHHGEVETRKEEAAFGIQLKSGIELRDLPDLLRIEINRISKMKYFEDQLEEFLSANGLPAIDETRSDGWIHFVHLYAKIVEDCPLVITANNQSTSIANVTLKLEMANVSAEENEGEVLFRVRWIVQDRGGESGEIFIMNSFSENPDGR